MPQKQTFPLTRRAFGEYIRKTGGRGARRSDNDRCPLTNALRTILPKPKDDGDLRVTIGTFDKVPQWATNFMILYDGDKGRKGLTATQAARKVGAIR